MTPLGLRRLSWQLCNLASYRVCETNGSCAPHAIVDAGQQEDAVAVARRRHCLLQGAEAGAVTRCSLHSRKKHFVLSGTDSKNPTAAVRVCSSGGASFCIEGRAIDGTLRVQTCPDTWPLGCQIPEHCGMSAVGHLV